MRRRRPPGRTTIRRRLIRKRSELLAGVDRPKRDPLPQPGDDGEHATTSHDAYVSTSVGDMAFRQLIEVDLALDRLERGDYGVCAACQQPIKQKRLRSIPWAVYCVECQDQSAAPPNRIEHNPGDEIRQ